MPKFIRVLLFRIADCQLPIENRKSKINLLAVTVLFWAVLVNAQLAALAAGQPYPVGDVDGDRDVDFEDLQVLASQWLDEACPAAECEADLNGSSTVDSADFALLAQNWLVQTTTPVISEFMASNGSKPPPNPPGVGDLLDEDKDSSDWIEIYNPTDGRFDISGWHLTDDRNVLAKWEFPDGIWLEPGQFLIVFASGKNRAVAGSELHTNFQLDADNPEYLALVESDGATIAHEYDYPTQLTNISYGLRQFAKTLIASGATASYHVPTAMDADLPSPAEAGFAQAGAQWTAVTFDDSTWDTAKTGLGFVPRFIGDVIDVTNPGDVVQGVPNDGDWPSDESPPLAIDNNVNTKYLHFKGDFDSGDPPGGAGFQITPSIGPSIVTGLTFTTANDAPERDPTAFALYGSNVSINGPYTLIAAGNIVDFNRASAWPRYTKNATPITFSNNTAYYHYQLLFPAIRDAATSAAMQIAEVEFLGSPAGLAASDIQKQMQNINASLWVRLKFELGQDEPELFDTLSLRAKYEDAFVAYLNGIEVARSNFEGPLRWNSSAQSNRQNSLAMEFVSFDISGAISLLRVSTNILAIHALNDKAGDGDFLILPELIAASSPDSLGIPQYFTQATPGKFNVPGAIDVVADTKFSRDRGFYDEPFLVSITTETEGATIHYTTDGSTPTEVRGQPYTGPIPIPVKAGTATTCLRAMAFKPGWISTNVGTQTYIFPADVIRQPASPAGFPASWGSTTADYAMDSRVVNDLQYRGLMRNSLLSLPTISIVTDLNNLFGATGIYDNSTMAGVAWERPASIEWINPDGTTGFQVDAGLRIYGGDPFRGMSLTRKKSFRLLFKRQYGPSKLDFPMFDAEDAATSFDTIVLRAGANDGWNNWTGSGNGPNVQYILDEFIRRTQLALGQVSPHGTFVHLYINGLYWGLYNPVERPMSSFCATYYGGDKEEWDALNSGTPTGESSTTTWNAMLSQASAGLSDNVSYQKIQGNNPDGTRNPAYDDLLDIDNYIDWLFSNFWGGTADWPYHNFYVGCRRPPNTTGFKFFDWDAEYVIVIGSNLNSNVTGVSDNGARPYVTLRQNNEFRLLFADHAHRHLFNNGPATTEPSYARYKELADQIELAIIAESARWGDMGRSNSPFTLADWQARRNYILGTYMPQRPAIVLGQLRAAGLYPIVDAPVFSINGLPSGDGHVWTGGILTMTAPKGQILYTLDGHDPRVPMVQSAPVATFTLVAENAAKRVLVPTSAISDVWKGGQIFDDSAWIGGTRGVGYEAGSGYEGFIGIDVKQQMYNKNGTCYIRIPFTLSAGQLAAIKNLTLKVRYDDGFVAYINGSEVQRALFTGAPAWNSLADTGHNDSAAVNFESFDISDHIGTLQQGDNSLAIHGLNTPISSSDFLISVELVASEAASTNPAEVSPTAVEYKGPITLTKSTQVKSRVLSSTWSALNEAVFAVGPVAENLRITEIMYHPATTFDPNDPNAEFIELTNIGADSINLNLVRFTEAVQFIFPDLQLAPGQYVLLVKDRGAFDAYYPECSAVIAGEYEGSLDNAGERIRIEDAIGRTILDFEYKDGWYDVTDGDGYSLTIINPSDPDANNWGLKDRWRPSALFGGSPGYDDTGIVPNPGSVVINEVLAHSHGGAADWIELHNTTGAPISIGGWFLSDSDQDDLSIMKYRIADGTTIEPNGYIVFYEDQHFGPGSPDLSGVPFALSENGDKVVLTSAVGDVLTGYRDVEDFDASETDVSFGRYRKSGGTYNFVPLSFRTPGSANAYPLVGPIVINEIMYNPDPPANSSYDNDDFEYIELHNISDVPVTLYDAISGEPWKFTDGIEFSFPTDSPVTVPAGGYLLIVKNPEAFAQRWQTIPASRLVGIGPYEGRLDNSGEKVEIGKPGDVDQFGTRYYIRVDRVNYSDGSHPVGEDLWPSQADGGGKSLTRKVPQEYGNDVVNWKAAEPSPGAANP